MENSNNNKPKADQSILDEIMHQQQDRLLTDPYGLGMLNRLGPNPAEAKKNKEGAENE